MRDTFMQQPGSQNYHLGIQRKQAATPPILIASSGMRHARMGRADDASMLGKYGTVALSQEVMSSGSIFIGHLELHFFFWKLAVAWDREASDLMGTFAPPRNHPVAHFGGLRECNGCRVMFMGVAGSGFAG